MKSLGFKADHREFQLPAEVLKALGLKQVKLLSNNPQKVSALEVRRNRSSGASAVRSGSRTPRQSAI